MEESWRRFKQGDKVIVKNLPVGSNYYHPLRGKKQLSFNHEMQRECGREHTIKHVHSGSHGNTYKLEKEEMGWIWTDEMLEPIILPSSNKEASSLLMKEW